MGNDEWDAGRLGAQAAAWHTHAHPGTVTSRCLHVKRSAEASLQESREAWMCMQLGCILPIFLHKKLCHTRVEHFEQRSTNHCKEYCREGILGPKQDKLVNLLQLWHW